MGNLWQDIRYGARMLARSPGFTAAAVVSLALGIGANSTIFSVINTLLLRSFAVEAPERLVAVFGVRADGSGPGDTVSYPDYVDYRDQNQSLEGLCAYFPVVPLSLAAGERPERVWGQLVTGNYFSVLGVRPVVGRAFLPEEDLTPGSHPVVVISHSLWRSRFQSDPRTVGRAIQLNGRSFTVVGVAPEGFQGTDVGFDPALWAPMSMLAQLVPVLQATAGRRGSQFLYLVGRLKPGTSLREVQMEFAVIAGRLREAYPDTNKDRGARVERAGAVNPVIRDVAVGFSGLLMAVVGAVLLLACANVANLLRARATARRREIAIRLAVGAGRWRLVRQLLTESLLLALLGGALGLLLAVWATGALGAYRLPIPFPVELRPALDLRVAAFTTMLAILTGVIFGLAPALSASRSELVPALKDGTPSAAGGRNRLRSALVVGQVAVSLVLLMAGGLFVRSMRNAHTIDPGFDPSNVLMLSVDPTSHGYAPQRAKALLRQITERAEALPGARSASLVDIAPLRFGRFTTGVVAEGQQPTEGPGSRIDRTLVATRYFETMRIPMLRGRDFTPQDNEAAPRVVILNETAASRLFPKQDPLDKRLRERSGGRHWARVIGVVKDGKYRTLGEQPQLAMFMPLAQNYDVDQFFGTTLVLRTAGPPRGMLAAVEREIRGLDASLAVFQVRTMDEHLNDALFLARMGATLFGAFGLLGLALAAVGLYGIIAYSVGRRTHEIGIRMALGAGQSEVLRLVLGQGLALTSAGLAIGLALSVGVTRFASTFLYGVSPTDPATFAGVSLFLLLVALAASYVPARRAAQLDPLGALRHE